MADVEHKMKKNDEKKKPYKSHLLPNSEKLQPLDTGQGVEMEKFLFLRG